ncbi:MAG: hypothetical protein HC777_01115 [Hyphomonadaceae bacterium]|nr:hypothetical protein [Hyphomonadaceae bacterium]
MTIGIFSNLFERVRNPEFGHGGILCIDLGDVRRNVRDVFEQRLHRSDALTASGVCTNMNGFSFAATKWTGTIAAIALTTLGFGIDIRYAMGAHWHR